MAKIQMLIGDFAKICFFDIFINRNFKEDKKMVFKYKEAQERNVGNNMKIKGSKNRRWENKRYRRKRRYKTRN